MIDGRTSRNAECGEDSSSSHKGSLAASLRGLIIVRVRKWECSGSVSRRWREGEQRRLHWEDSFAGFSDPREAFLAVAGGPQPRRWLGRESGPFPYRDGLEAW